MRIEKRLFKVLDPHKPSVHQYYFQSWYSPIFLKKRDWEEDNDNSCCITFEVKREGLPEENSKKIGKAYIVLASIVKPFPMDSHEVLIHAKNLYNDFTNNSLLKLPPAYDQKAIIIPANESAHNHFAFQLQMDDLPIKRLAIENNGTDIEGLLYHAIKVLRQDRFFLRHNDKNKNSLRTIDSDFLSMVSSYPSPEVYALIYAWAQALTYADKFMYLFDDRPIEDKKPFEHGYGVDT